MENIGKHKLIKRGSSRDSFISSSYSVLKSPLIILLIALGFRLMTVCEGYLKRGYDGRCYSLFVETLGEHGIEGIRSLIRQLPENDDINMGPLPLRILFIFVGLLSCKLLGYYGAQSLALISFISGIGVIIMSFILFKKWFRPHTAFLASVLLVTSPLGTALSRYPLQDSFFTFIVIASIFFYHQCWNHKRNIDIIMLGVTVLAGFLTKESMILLYVCFAVAGIYYRKKCSLDFPKKMNISLVTAPLVYLFIIVWVVGDFQTFFRTYIFYLQMQSKIPYVIQYQQGPWFRYIIDFMLLSPLTYLFSIVGIVAFLADKYDQDGRNLSTLYVLSGLAAFSYLSILSVRFVLFLDVPLRALSAVGILFVAGKIRKPTYRYVITTLLIMAVLSIDTYQFFRIFIKERIHDPVTFNLMEANGFFVK